MKEPNNARTQRKLTAGQKSNVTNNLYIILLLLEVAVVVVVVVVIIIVVVVLIIVFIIIHLLFSITYFIINKLYCLILSSRIINIDKYKYVFNDV